MATCLVLYRRSLDVCLAVCLAVCLDVCLEVCLEGHDDVEVVESTPYIWSDLNAANIT